MLTIGLYGVRDPQGNHAGHDHALAFMRDGRVEASIELERVTGRKHDDRLDEYFDSLIAPWLRPGEPVRLVQVNSFLGSSFSTRSGSLTLTSPDSVPLEPRLVSTKCRVEGPLARHNLQAYTLCHELAHVGTCLPFYGPYPADTLLVHIDGGASLSASSAWYWDGAHLRLIESSWDELKAAVNNFNDSPLAAGILGLDLTHHLSLPGKLMGLASYGTPRPKIMEWLLDHDFFLGEPWRHTDPLLEVARRFGPRTESDPTRDPVHHDIAACMQRYLEKRVLAYLARLKASTGARHLAYSGGAALNVHTNVRIENELGFESVMIPPAPSDCGLALGAAAFAEWLDGGPIARHGPYLTRLSPDEPGADSRPAFTADTRELADRLAAGDIIATVLGGAEVGPRALGHRSLLARPDSVPLRRRLSEEMKQREWYRPVAPVVLPHVAAQCLQGYRANSSLGRSMLGAWRLVPAWRAAFEGCVHVDGTVRVQVLDTHDPGQAPLVDLLRTLECQYGIQGLINTSLNSKGMAILQESARAVAEARRIGVERAWST